MVFAFLQNRALINTPYREVAKYIFALLMLAITGCSNNVYFFDRDGWDESSNAISIHVDAFGNIYPDKGFAKTFNPDKKFEGSLYNLVMSEASTLCDNVDMNVNTGAKILCEVKFKYNTKPKLERCDPIDNGCPMNPDWRSAQTILWNNAGKNIYSLSTADDKNSPVVFLIHGFNTPSAIDNYEYARNKILSLVGKDIKPLFVEVHWDGFTSTIGPDIWSKAQASGPLVGFHLRQLFRGMELGHEENSSENIFPKIRILTHSSGAFVIGSTLGNAKSAQPLTYREGITDQDYLFYRAHISDTTKGTYAIPNFPDIRVGMLAAATPSTTFVGYKPIDKSDKGGILAKNTTLIFSINPKDKILTKYVFNPNFSAIGATGAGADFDLYCYDLSPKLNDMGVENHAFNFIRNDSWWPIWEDHKFTAYLSQDASEQFLKKLMDADIEYSYVPC